MLRIFSRVLLLLTLSVVSGKGCLAGGILHAFAPVVDGRSIAVARATILLSKTLITVSESSAEHRIDQTFYNNNDFPLTGVFLVPMGTDEIRGSPTLTIDGVGADFELLSPADFFGTLKRLTLDCKDPSLLSLAGQRVLVVRDVKLGVRQQKSFRLTYHKPCRLMRDHEDVLVRLDGERYSRGPVGELEIGVRVKASRPVRAVFSASHHISVFREAPHRCLAVVRHEGVPVRRHFHLQVLYLGSGLDLRLFTYRQPGSDGAFMAFILPPMTVATERQPGKDVVFLLDSSGSMGRKHLKLAKRAVTFCLERLQPGDSFNVMVMGTRVKKMTAGLIQATENNVRDAARFVDSVEAVGGTDLYNGLIDALELFKSKRGSAAIVLVGDGRGTVGITDPALIVEDAVRKNRLGVRLFALAVGESPDMVMLGKLAEATRGSIARCSESGDLAAVMNRFFGSVSPARAVDIALRFENVRTQEVKPHPIPDLFGDQCSVVLGRYVNLHDTVANVELKASVNKRGRTVTRSFVFPEVDTRRPYIQTLWAMRQLAELVERSLLKTSDAGIRKEIHELAGLYGLKNPLGPRSGRKAVSGRERDPDLGVILWTLKTSRVPADAESEAFRHENAKVFRRENGRWVDVRYVPNMPTVTFRFLGEGYFSLLRQAPEIGAYLALGPHVTFLHGNTAVVIVSDR